MLRGFLRSGVSSLGLAAAVAMVAGAALAADAPSKGSPAAPAAPAAATSADAAATEAAQRQLHLMMNLIDYGRSAHDPEALILASRMMSSMKPGDSKKLDVKVTTAPVQGAKHSSSAQKSKGASVTASSLLDEAEAMSNGDEQVVAQIKAERAKAPKGFVATDQDRVAGQDQIDTPSGPVSVYYVVDHLDTGYYDQWQGVATEGEPALAGAIGEPGSDIDIRVFDENGHQICQDTLTDRIPMCVWTPAWTGKYTVRVYNAGDYNSNIEMFWK